MSSHIGISEVFNGTDYFRYEPGKYLYDSYPNERRCFFEYTDLIERDGSVVGFLRQKGQPSDTQVVVLDLLSKSFYKTIRQGDLRLTILGDCEEVK